MPVTSHFYFNEIWEGRDGGLDENGIRTYTRTFLSGMLNLNADALEVTAGVGGYATPPRLSAYVNYNRDGTVRSTDLGARLYRYECRQQEDPQFWKVYCRYSSDWRLWRRSPYDPTKKEGSGGENKGDPSEINPLLQPADISWQTVKFQEPVRFSANGLPLMSSAKEQFIPPVMRDQTRLVLVLEKNLATYDASTYQLFFDKVNSLDWILGIQKGTCKCDGITGKSVMDRGIFYYKVRGTFHIIDFPDVLPPNLQNAGLQTAWDKVLLDEGSQYLDANGNLSTLVTQKTGLPVNGRFLLDGTGHALPPGGQPVYFDYIVYDTIDFHALQLYP
jgi:hypothetical protein